MSFQMVRTVLTDRPSAIGPSIPVTASVSAAIALMPERNVDAVIATDRGRFAGVLTARDALKHLLDASRDPATMPVTDALAAGLPMVDASTTVHRALELLDESGRDHVAVSSHGEVTGVLSRGDLTQWIIRNQQYQLDCAIRAAKWVGYSNRRP